MTNFDDYAQDDFFQELEIDQSKILDYSISEKIAALDPAGQKDFWWQFYQQARQMHRFFVASSELRANFDVDAVYNRRNADEVYLARPAGSQLSGPCLLLQGVIDSFGFDKNDRPESCQSLFVPENEAAFSYELNTDDGLIDLYALTYQESDHALNALGFNLKHRQQIHAAGELDY